MSPLGFTMSLRAGDDGNLHAEIAPSGEAERFHLCETLLVLRLWRESNEIVRCSILHPASGNTAYLQGNGEITGLIQALQIRLAVDFGKNPN
jgi:hypothetical protein